MFVVAVIDFILFVTVSENARFLPAITFGAGQRGVTAVAVVTDQQTSTATRLDRTEGTYLADEIIAMFVLG